MHKPISVLILDDEREFLSSLELLFATEPYAVFATTHPFEALGMLSREPIKVIICDLRMPMVSGANFFKEVRESFPHIMRILLTGHADMHAAEEVVNEGQVFAFFCKPCNPDTLIAAVRRGIEAFDRAVEDRQMIQSLRDGEHALPSALAGIRADIDQLMSADSGALSAVQLQILSRLAEKVERLSRGLGKSGQ